MPQVRSQPQAAPLQTLESSPGLTLPASLALSTAVLHRTRATRFLLPAYLVVVNAALLQLTLQRYLDGDPVAVRELVMFWTR